MSPTVAPKTPDKAKAEDKPRRQLVTPPNSERPSKVVVLKVDPEELSTLPRNPHDTIPHRRLESSKLSQMLRHPFAPPEAVAVAINPFYRGKELDGDYYKWLLVWYDGDMPDIIRRINRFRGFPQNDDPSWNKADADVWKARYATEEYKAEFQQYRPYLLQYWNRSGDDFDEHIRILCSYHENTSYSDGREDILWGIADDHILGDIALSVSRLSSPPSLDGKDAWLEELKDFRRDFLRSMDTNTFSELAWRAIGAVQDASPRLPTSQASPITVRSGRIVRKDPKVSPTAVSGLYKSPYHDQKETISPGLLWTNRPDVSEDDPAPKLPREMDSPADYSLTSPRMPPSVDQYHSPAGDLSSPRHIPDDPDFALIKARSDVQALAVANGFVPSPRNGIGPLADRKDGDQQNEGSISGDPVFPMGAFRYCPGSDKSPIKKSPSNKLVSKTSNKSGSPSPSSPLDSARVSPKKRKLTHGDPQASMPFSAADDTSVDQGLCTPNPRQQRAGGKRKRGPKKSKQRKRRNQKAKKNDDDDDEDYEYKGDDENDEDKQYEQLPPKQRTTIARPRRTKNASTSVAAPEVSEASLRDTQSIKRLPVSEQDDEEHNEATAKPEDAPKHNDTGLGNEVEGTDNDGNDNEGGDEPAQAKQSPKKRRRAASN
ncbi:hypothetical protein AB5N19_07326 [Seiridium cardinale]